MAQPVDTQAVNTIVEILSQEGDWNADHFDAIAKVLDAVRDRGPESTWIPTGDPMEWGGHAAGYVVRV